MRLNQKATDTIWPDGSGLSDGYLDLQPAS